MRVTLRLAHLKPPDTLRTCILFYHTVRGEINRTSYHLFHYFGIGMTVSAPQRVVGSLYWNKFLSLFINGDGINKTAAAIFRKDFITASAERDKARGSYSAHHIGAQSGTEGGKYRQGHHIVFHALV